MNSWLDVKRFVAAAVIFITLAAISPSLMDRFWPPSYWIDMQAAHVEDAVQGSSPRVEERRVVKRKFTGTYSVEIELKQFTPLIGYRLICRASGGPFEYAPDNVPPNTLSEWVDDACIKAGGSATKIDVRHLAPGIYRVETCRSIFPARIFSEKRTCVTSNDFKILATPA